MLKQFMARIRGDAVIHHRQWRSQVLQDGPMRAKALSLRLKGLLRQNPLAKITWPNIQNPMWIRVNTSDEYVFEEIFLHRQYAFNLPSPASILDAGANIGLAAIWFANQYPTAEIIAIEPDAANFRLLRKNTQPYANIRCIQSGLWYRNCRLAPIANNAKPWAYQFEESDSSHSIGATDLSSLAMQFSSHRIDLAKIDVEGAEREIFRHSTDWLNRVNHLIVECHDRLVEGCETAVRDGLSSIAFQEQRHGDNLCFIRSNMGDPPNAATTSRNADR